MFVFALAFADPTITPAAEDTRPTQAETAYRKVVLARGVKKRMKRIEGCYNQALEADPVLEADVVIGFTVVDRRAESVVVKETSAVDPTLATCVAAQFERMRFGSLGAGTWKVTYPLAFRPDGDGDQEG